jgi:ABC-type multidrug transport system ATPase subunit
LKRCGDGWLALRDVDMEYDFRPVLTGVTLALEPATTYLMTADNGSGKTTLLKIMAGLAVPTRGKVLWGDSPLVPAVRRRLGVVLQAPMLYGDLTGYENLVLFAALYGVARPQAAADEWLARVQLDWAKHQRVREYSKGMRQRLAIARAMVHEPSVLLLDEPFDGLDSTGRDAVEGLLADTKARGATVFVVIHEAEHRIRADHHLTIRQRRLVEVS